MDDGGEVIKMFEPTPLGVQLLEMCQKHDVSGIANTLNSPEIKTDPVFDTIYQAGAALAVSAVYEHAETATTNTIDSLANIGKSPKEPTEEQLTTTVESLRLTVQGLIDSIKADAVIALDPEPSIEQLIEQLASPEVAEWFALLLKRQALSQNEFSGLISETASSVIEPLTELADELTDYSQPEDSSISEEYEWLRNVANELLSDAREHAKQAPQYLRELKVL